MKSSQHFLISVFFIKAQLKIKSKLDINIKFAFFNPELQIVRLMKIYIIFNCFLN